MAGLYPDRDHRGRNFDSPSTVSVPMEAMTSKQRREKAAIKGQQDEEEERGKQQNQTQLSYSYFSF